MNKHPDPTSATRRRLRVWLLAAVLAVIAAGAVTGAVLVFGGEQIPRHYQENPTPQGPGWFSPGPPRSPR